MSYLLPQTPTVKKMQSPRASVSNPIHIMVPPSHPYASRNMLDRRLDLSGFSFGGIGKSSKPLPLSLAVAERDSCDLPAFLFAVPGRERGASRLGKGVTSGASSSTTWTLDSLVTAEELENWAGKR
jgi:hypothetical protein